MPPPPDVYHEYLFALQREASSALDRPEAQTPRLPEMVGSLQFQLQIMQHGGDWHCLTIWEQNASCRVRRVTWLGSRAPETINHLTVFLPSRVPELQLQARDADVPSEAWQELLKAGASLRLPWKPPHTGSICLDGYWCRLRTGGPFGNSLVEWTNDGPPAWSPLITWAGEVRTFLDSLLQGSGGPGRQD